MSAVVEGVEVTELFMSHSPDWSKDWSDGSSANTYGSLGVLWDSGDNIGVIDLSGRSEDETADIVAKFQQDTTELDAENWPWDEWEQLCSYPDNEATGETYDYIASTLAK